ncbi:hypothetical protein GAS36_16295 [Phocaeicola vulgatus]|nr:hypothetical protein GAS36_16295 [Phocaeicola vulgatus]RGT05186.1 hypothetical protein DWX60_01630 [Phocaeicola vulgatus]
MSGPLSLRLCQNADTAFFMHKAPACESRGFVHKKRGVHFDTSFVNMEGIAIGSFPILSNRK